MDRSYAEYLHKVKTVQCIDWLLTMVSIAPQFSYCKCKCNYKLKGKIANVKPTQQKCLMVHLYTAIIFVR